MRVRWVCLELELAVTTLWLLRDPRDTERRCWAKNRSVPSRLGCVRTTPSIFNVGCDGRNNQLFQRNILRTKSSCSAWVGLEDRRKPEVWPPCHRPREWAWPHQHHTPHSPPCRELQLESLSGPRSKVPTTHSLQTLDIAITTMSRCDKFKDETRCAVYHLQKITFPGPRTPIPSDEIAPPLKKASEKTKRSRHQLQDMKIKGSSIIRPPYFDVEPQDNVPDVSSRSKLPLPQKKPVQNP